MKTRIDIGGRLIVEAENETEAYALDKWLYDYNEGTTLQLIIIKPTGAYWEGCRRYSDAPVVKIDINGVSAFRCSS